MLAFDRQTAAEFGTPVEEVKAAILLYALPPNQHLAAPLQDSFASRNSENCRFARQIIENSCALMAMLHLLMNDSERLWQEDPLLLKRLLEIDSPIDAGTFIAGVEELYDLHHQYAGFPEEDGEVEEVLYHFVAVVPRGDGKVLMFDGRRGEPSEFEGENGDTFGSICRVVNELKSKHDIEVLSAMALI